MNPKLKNLVIFILIFIYFFLIQGTTHFADPDCFYNTKMALLMKEQLIFQEFPWLQFSVLKDNFVDHHFLYHVFLIPFVSLDGMGIDPLLGVRISAMLLATLLVFVFYGILKKFKIRHALFFVILLLISTPFIFRISLARAPAISGVFLLLGTYLILDNLSGTMRIKGRINAERFNWLLFIISFFYVWLYSAWLLLPVILFFYLVGSAVYHSTHNTLRINSRSSSRWFASIKQAIRDSRAKITACVSGIVAGLIINPYFPQNLKFYYHQIVQISVVNFHHKFGVGSEWYPYEPVALYKNLFIFFVFLLISIALFFVMRKRQDKKSWVLLLITCFFFIYTLKARRSVEYLVPFGVLFMALVYDNLFHKKSWSELEKRFKNFFSQQQRLILIILSSILVFMAPYFIYHDLIGTHKNLQHFEFSHLQKASHWLKDNVPAKQIVFNSNWDNFGFLFYNNSKHYYITGLDQTFMYSYNPELLELYIDITRGLNIRHLKDNLKQQFNAEYVLVEQERNKKFYRSLKMLDKDFEMVYEDGEMSVFKVKH